MTEDGPGTFRIGRWHVAPALGRATCESGMETLRPKEMELLVYLAQNEGKVVSTDDIMANVWSEVEVTNDSLYFSISQLRKRLDIPDAEKSLIETMPKRGYRLTAPIEWIHVDPPAERPQSAASPESRESRPWARWLGYGAAVAVLLLAAAGWFREPQSASVAPGSQFTPGSIAVMPLIDLSPDTNYTYFSDGITDEILNRLARIHGMQVAARTSSFAFKNQEASVAEIGAALGVETILEGSVRKDGDTVRVSVQLIDTTSGFQLWSETYERQLISIFAIQNDISRDIAAALQLALAPDAAGSEAGELLASDPRVVEEYLLGLEALRAKSFDAYGQAQQHFEFALQIDPAFTPAMIQLADAKLGTLSTGASDDLGLIDQAESLVRRALQSDPNSGPAHRILSMISRWRGEWDIAEQQIRRAIELTPSDSVSMVTLGEIHMIRNDLGNAERAFERALRIDPYGAAAMMKLSWLKQRLGEIDEARAIIERAIVLHPKNPNLPWRLGMIQVGELGDLVGGLENLLLSAALDPRDYEIAAYVAMTYLTLGMPDVAREWLDKVKAAGPDTAAAQALEASYLQLSGATARATDVAAAAIGERNYRLLFHEMLTENLIVIAAHNLIEAKRIDDAIELFEKTLPATTASLGPGKNLVLDGTIMVMNKFSDAWMVALASLYAERGDLERAENLFDAAATNRAAIDNRQSGFPGKGHFLMEARAAAMLGEPDKALDLIEEAVSRNLLFAWQIQVAGDYAFRNVRSEPRFRAIIGQLQAKVDRQRALVLAAPALLRSGKSTTVQIGVLSSGAP